ncbi:hypothetical protein PsYK624_123070 [Phanerochaete sordida]|uniref:Uncharacterized protein n=1 Tax=Phanerochaete sordida TaxID=48140 RepID=A0A9P3LIX3_9APHY|nr:hypothetical protein PsYK624_123070 [Phanerochaete sordida]
MKCSATYHRREPAWHSRGATRRDARAGRLSTVDDQLVPVSRRMHSSARRARTLQSSVAPAPADLAWHAAPGPPRLPFCARRKLCTMSVAHMESLQFPGTGSASTPWPALHLRAPSSPCATHAAKFDLCRRTRRSADISSRASLPCAPLAPETAVGADARCVETSSRCLYKRQRCLHAPPVFLRNWLTGADFEQLVPVPRQAVANALVAIVRIPTLAAGSLSLFYPSSRTPHIRHTQLSMSRRRPLPRAQDTTHQPACRSTR